MNKLKSIRLKGRLIDGTGNPAIENGVVVVSGDSITWAGPAEAQPAQYADPAIEERGGPGFTVMPGLIDGHIHISFGEARSEEENALYTPPEYRALRAAWHARKPSPHNAWRRLWLGRKSRARIWARAYHPNTQELQDIDAPTAG